MNNHYMLKEQYSHQMHNIWQHKTDILIQTSKNVMKTQFNTVCIYETII